jgi:hypothetical protein
VALSSDLAASIAQLVRESRFVFSGTVERASSSSLALIPAGSTSSVVRVDRIHSAAPALQSQSGQEVTVLHGDRTDSTGEGYRRVFFTNPILYGETMGVREVGTLDAVGQIEDVHALVARVMEESSMEELRQHLESADAVLQGRVVALVRVSEATAATISEHDPDWWVAEIEVARALKGKHKGKVRVRYPNSRDVRWYGVPKPREGDEAVFVLHNDGLNVGDVALAMIHPGDMAPVGSAEARRITELMGRGRGSKASEE